MKSRRFLFLWTIITLLIFGGPSFFPQVPDASAKSRFGSSSSYSSSRGSSYGKSSRWSVPTQGTWNRSGGGLFGNKPASSSGYAKPSLQKTVPATGSVQPSPSTGPSSSGYGKPTLQQGTPASGAAQSTPAGASSSGYAKPSLGKGQSAPAGVGPTTERGTTSSGYAKPSLSGNAPTAVQGGGPAATTSQSSGYAKPSLKSGTTGGQQPIESKTSGGYAKPVPGTGAKQGFAGGSKFDKQALNQEKKKAAQESLLRYKSENSKFQKPAPKLEAGYENNPLYQKGKVYSGFDYGTHYDRRDSYYRNQGYTPPAAAFGSAPRFGMFDTLFLFWMLNHASNRNVAATAYHHSEDPGFKQWREEVERTAKTDPEMKAKLAEMDKQIKALQGTPKDPGYLPAGVPTDVALAADVLASKKPETAPIRLAAGQAGGWYDKFAGLFKKAAKDLDVTVIPTGGSMENLKLLVGGKADLAIVQSDALAVMEKMLPGKKLVSEQSTLYPEYVQLIANTGGGVHSVRDIDPRKNVLYVGPKESGTSLTWQGLCEQYPAYRKIPIRNADYSAALAEVERNPKALMLFVGGLNSEFLKKAEEEAKKSGKLRLVAVDDRHFKNKRDSHGNPIYTFVDIGSSVYPALQKGWIFSGDVKTLAVQAVLVLRTEWAEKYGPQAMDALSRAILEARPEVQRLVNVKK
jgi:TRAP transporter TAXI family solute receptor